ncbi:GNAT family N-acetyltransferase [Glycomyces sp. MUSA5-2]|uniref:GNAT family N-acetyltransferase n=1 Tax=Glycomyces sp. MUSA5-2 TaxID=2053002 RepID=UPI0030098077
MTFQTRARRVRNPELPMGQRYTALRCALEDYRQMGFHASWAFLTGADGRRKLDAESLVRALDRLEASRNARMVEQEAFAARRMEAKRAGRRQPEPDEVRYRRGRRWPGPDAHEATRFAVAYEWRRIGDEPHERFAAVRDGLERVVTAYLGAGLDREGRLLLARVRAELTEAERELRDQYPAFRSGFKLRRIAETIELDTFPLVRRGWAGDVDAVARIFWAARSGMPYLPALYTREQTDWWVREVMVPQSEVLVAEHRGVPVGFAALDGDLLAHLYIEPGSQGRGIGEALLERAKRRRRSLDLRVFAANTGARAFYARHGFSEVGADDGSGNEEGLPDLLLRWRR